MKSKIIFLLIVMLCLNGLNNSRELNDLAIVSAMGIDLDENGNYIITSQILNTKKENSSGSGSASSSGSSEIVVYNSTYSSIQTALRNTINESPRRLYLAHMELLLISEKVAKEKEILDTLNFFIRDNEDSTDFMLVITKDTTPQEVLQVTTPLESNPAQDIRDSILATHRYRGFSTDNLLNDSLTMFKGKNSIGVVTCIELASNKSSNQKNPENSSQQESALLSQTETSKEEGNNENKIIRISDLGYFKDQKLNGYLNQDESYLYNIITDNSIGGIIEFNKDDDLIVMEEIKGESKLVPTVINDNYYIDIKINMTCNITETGKNIEFNSNSDIENYEKQAEEYLKNEIEKFIEKSKTEYNCDLFGLGNVFYKYKNKDYKNLKSKYGDDYFKYINTNVSVNVSLPSEGGIENAW